MDIAITRPPTIIVTTQYFRDLQSKLASLPLSLGGLSITHASDLFCFAFLSSRFDTLDLQIGLLSLAPLPAADPALDSALALAPPSVRAAYAHLAARRGTLAIAYTTMYSYMFHILRALCG